MTIYRLIALGIVGVTLQGKAIPPALDIEVTVVSHKTTEPIAGAVVAVRATGSIVANGPTNADGLLEVRNVPAGEYAITVGKSDKYAGNAVKIVIDPSKSISRVTVSLSEVTAKVNGRVDDSKGHPLAGVVVHAFMLGYSEGRLGFVTGDRNTKTDDRGEYRLFGLASGEYVIRADYTAAPVPTQLSAESAGVGSPRQRLPRNLGELNGAAAGAGELPPPVLLYFRGKLGPDEAERVEISEGEEIKGINLTFPSDLHSNGRSISGTVASEVSGVDIARMTSPLSFYLASRDPAILVPPIVMRSRRTSGGAFELLDVPTGPYDLFAVSSVGALPFSGRVSLDASSQDVRSLLVTIRAGSDLKGLVTVEGESTLIDLSKLAVRLTPSDSLPTELLGPSRSASRLNSDGSFVVQGLPAAHYMVAITGLSGNSYISDIQSDGKSAFGDAEIVVAGQPLVVKLKIRTDGGSVKGTTSGKEPRDIVDGSTVVLVPQAPYRGNHNLYRVASADSLGTFQLNGIAPGRYNIFAWRDVPNGAWLNREFLAKYEGKSTEVTIGQGEVVVTAISRLDSAK